MSTPSSRGLRVSKLGLCGMSVVSGTSRCRGVGSRSPPVLDKIPVTGSDQRNTITNKSHNRMYSLGGPLTKGWVVVMSS